MERVKGRVRREREARRGRGGVEAAWDGSDDSATPEGEGLLKTVSRVL